MILLHTDDWPNKNIKTKHNYQNHDLHSELSVTAHRAKVAMLVVVCPVTCGLPVQSPAQSVSVVVYLVKTLHLLMVVRGSGSAAAGMKTSPLSDCCDYNVLPPSVCE